MRGGGGERKKCESRSSLREVGVWCRTVSMYSPWQWWGVDACIVVMVMLLHACRFLWWHGHSPCAGNPSRTSSADPPPTTAAIPPH